MRTLILAAAALLMAGPALAGPVTLKANPVDADGAVTLGDIFDGAEDQGPHDFTCALTDSIWSAVVITLEFIS